MSLSGRLIHPPGFQPLEVQADKWAAPVTVMLSAGQAERDLCVHLSCEGGSLQGQEGLILLLWGLLDTREL